MIVYVCSFTKRGREVTKEIAEAFPMDIYRFFEEGDHLSEWVREGFNIRAPFIFVCATGIAVRSIAPYVNSKLIDSPILVVDENREFVIPILSGHIGGANELAYTLADTLGLVPVITTSTDINGKFAVDMWAKANGLTIYNKDGIGKVTSKILKDEKIILSNHTNIKFDLTTLPEEVCTSNAECGDVIISDDIRMASECSLLLVPKRICIGVGCKKDTDVATIEKQINKALAENTANDCESLGVPYVYDNIYGIASIDLKAKEYGLVEFAQKNGLKYVTYSAEELKAVEGDFSESEFVEKITGVSNICERAAVKLAGSDGRLIVRKHASDGVTVAIAVRYQD